MRTKSGQVKAFYNVCRHRGSRVCLEQQGSKKLIVCPYHGWSYDSDGRLIGSPNMPSGFDKNEHGLVTCHVEVSDGLIFINLAREEAPDFDNIVNRLRPYLVPYQLSRTKAVAQEIFPCPANWKLVIENFAECYHCLNSHKDLMKIHDIDAISLYESNCDEAKQWFARAKGAGLITVPLSDKPTDPRLQLALCLKLKGDAVSGGKTGKMIAPLLGDMSEPSGSWMRLAFNPLSQVGCYDDHVVMFSFVPRGPLTTDCIVTWLVREDAVEGKDFDIDEITGMWKHTFPEDKTICANNQLGVMSSAYSPGPYSIVENLAAVSTEWYIHHFVDV